MKRTEHRQVGLGTRHFGHDKSLVTTVSYICSLEYHSQLREPDRRFFGYLYPGELDIPHTRNQIPTSVGDQFLVKDSDLSHNTHRRRLLAICIRKFLLLHPDDQRGGAQCHACLLIKVEEPLTHKTQSHHSFPTSPNMG